MKAMIALVLLLVFASAAFAQAQAQSMDDRIRILEETLKKQNQTVQELKHLQETLKKQEQAIEDQRKLIEQLKIEITRAQARAPAAAGEAKAAMAPAEVQRQVQELTEKVDQVVETQKKFVPSVFNPSIGFVGETVFSYNNRPLSQTGNTSGRPGGYDANLRSVELNAAASVDPFARGYIVANASADPVTGEATSG